MTICSRRPLAARTRDPGRDAPNRSALNEQGTGHNTAETERTHNGQGNSYAAFGVDVDAVAGWLGSYGGEDSPDDISRGLFAGEVGSPRLLKMFEQARHQDHLVHPRPLDRDLSQGNEGGG